jgi:hypothetical protein
MQLKKFDPLGPSAKLNWDQKSCCIRKFRPPGPPPPQLSSSMAFYGIFRVREIVGSCWGVDGPCFHIVEEVVKTCVFFTLLLPCRKKEVFLLLLEEDYTTSSTWLLLVSAGS